MASSKAVRASAFVIALAVVLVAIAWEGPPAAAQESMLLWVRQFGTSGDDEATAVAIDASGVYIAGVTLEGGWDGFLRKYNHGGSELWTRQFGSHSEDRPTHVADVAVDESGVYVLGWTSVYASRVFVYTWTLRKYDHDGNHVWIRQFSGPSGWPRGALAVDVGGVYIAASVTGVIAEEPGPGTPLSSWPGLLAAVGSTVFFRANDGTNDGLWKTDGTEVGTVFIKNVQARPMTAVGDTLFFGVFDNYRGLGGLWKTDGTEAGTVLVRDFRPGYLGYVSVAIGSTLFFLADDGAHGLELWKSDGTEAGTVLVKDVRPGPDGSSSMYPDNSEGQYLTAVGDTLFFTADDGILGLELWKSDGTEAGTVLVKDLRSGLPGSFPEGFVAIGSTLFFRAADGVHGLELWKSDGTEAGTVLVKDVRPGPNGSWSDWGWPNRLAAVRDILLFSADDGVHGLELWESDGTETGTFLVKDIVPGPGGFWTGPLTAAGSTVFFDVHDGTNPTPENGALWKSDGTEVGTALVKDIVLDSWPLTAVGDGIFFFTDDGTHGEELWKSDGTGAGTVLVKDIWPGPGPPQNSHSELLAVGSTLFFRGDDGTTGQELWKSDGTEAGTVLVKDIRPGVEHHDILIRKYDADGNEVWTRQFGTAGIDHAEAIAVDASGIYVAGGSEGDYGDVPGGFLLKYGHEGSPLLTRRGANAGGHPLNVAVDASGAYVAGGGECPGFLSRYDSDMNEVRTSRLGNNCFGGDYRDVPSGADAAAVDASGAYLAGYNYETLDAVVVRYDNVGMEVWSSEFGTVELDAATAIAVDESGIYVAGETFGTLPGETSSGEKDAFLVALAVSPSPPENLRAAARNSGIGLMWDAPRTEGVSPIASYRIYRGPDPGSLELIAVLDVTLRRYLDADVEIGVTYYYRASAVNVFGEGPASAVAEATVAESLLPQELDALRGALEATQNALNGANAHLAALGQQLLLAQLGLLGLAAALVLLLALPRLRRPSGPKAAWDRSEAVLPPGDASALGPAQPPPSLEAPASRSTRRMPRASPSDRTIRLTTKERILLHLAGHSRHREGTEVPPAMTQEGIAAGVWIEKRHLAQYLDPLTRDGLVGIRTAHVRNGRQRRKVYDLTDAGSRVAARLLVRAQSEVVPVWDGEHIWEVRVGEILEKTNRKVSVLDVARHLAEAGVVDFADLGGRREVSFAPGEQNSEEARDDGAP